MGNTEMLLAESSGGGGAFNLILLLAIPVVFYLLLIRPQNKRRREQMQTLNALQPGARVITTSGMHAEVVEVDDDGVLLEIAPGVEVRFVKAAIMNVITEADAGTDEDDEDEDADKRADGVDLAKDTDADDATERAEEKADKPSA